MKTYFDLKRRIAHLFDTPIPLNLLDDVSDLGIIAGGSMVYALNDFVPFDSVGDIDIFCPSIGTFRLILNLIIQTYPDYELSCPDEKTYSILNVAIPNEKVKFQLIYNKWDDPLDLIRSFDFDYVQCGIFKGELLITEDCKISHETRNISKCANTAFKNFRTIKAINKGFTCPVITNTLETYNDYKIIRLEDIKLSEFSEYDYSSNLNNDYLGYLNNTKNDVRLEDALIVSLEIVETKHLNLGNFCIKIGNDIIKKGVVSILLDIESCVKGRVNVRGKTKEYFDMIITHCDNIEPGKYVCLVRAYILDNKLRLKILEVIPMARPIEFSENFKIKGVYQDNCENYGKYNNVLECINRLSSRNKYIRGNQLELNNCKIKALESFLYYIKKKTELTAIQKACYQMNVDFNKLNDCSVDFIFFTNLQGEIKTVNEMIEFIEGFSCAK